MTANLELPQPPAAFLIVRSVIVDLSVLVGIGLLTYGSHLVYPPAAYLVSGLTLLVAGLNGARRA